ncbi:alpha/beta fold hydrolase [uncultured Roseibium sp.]|uniref:alpha/beta fold hydrolase n=1 Tax=uncultured Roseibium sp. TaxID=1936171 RepID=UPI0032164549
MNHFQPVRPDSQNTSLAVETDPAQPVAFDGLAGFFHAAQGNTAVLLLSPWGYEELCARKTYRLLGEKLAAAGFPCLRFDYPGTGHSLGTGAGLEDDGAWRASVRRALAELEDLSHARRVIVMGQGIGATLAGDLAEERELAGLVLLAPVAQGRAWLREVAAWTAMTQPTFFVAPSDGPEGSLMAGGFVLSAPTVGEIKSLNLMKGPAPRTEKLLLVERPDHPGDAKLAEHLEGEGLACDRLVFEGYADYVSDPTLSIPPLGTVDAVVDWVAATFPMSADVSPAAPTVVPPAILKGPDFQETLMRFGPGNMFFAALASPSKTVTKTAVLFLNAGYDHSIGWARMTVDFSRALARDGIAAFRMDLAGMGESPYWPGQARQVLYATKQNDDVKAAVDWLIGEGGFENVIVYGRCSGAYLAFVTAALDPRISGVFAVNPRRLVWDPDEDVDSAIREPIQTLSTYRSKALDPRNLGRVLSGEISLRKAASKVLSAIRRAGGRKLAPVLRGLSKHHRLNRVVHDRLQTLSARSAPVMLVYSVGDRGLSELENWVGPDLGGLKSYPNVGFSRIEGADHNLTPVAAREEVLELLRQFIRKF